MWAWSIWFDSSMENTLLRMAIGAAAMSAVFALPPLAAAESVVPPGNSAATQYTETFPTTGGNAEVNGSIDGSGLSHRGGGRSPEKVLGSHTAHELESQGEEGRTVAGLATESAPVTAGDGGDGKSGDANRDKGSGAGNGSGGSANGNGTGGTPVAAPEGSSGLSEVLGHATGSSSGEMGIFLPLLLLAAPLWALAYAWRRRQTGRAAS
jgi:hypothetical protein